jgi:hypothetical protein
MFPEFGEAQYACFLSVTPAHLQGIIQTQSVVFCAELSGPVLIIEFLRVFHVLKQF